MLSKLDIVSHSFDGKQVERSGRESLCKRAGNADQELQGGADRNAATLSSLAI